MSKAMTLFLPTALTILSLAACQASSENRATTASYQTVQTVAEVTAETYFSASDQDASYDQSTASTIELNGVNATVSGNGVSATKNLVKISNAGTYIVSGTSEGVQIVVDANASDEVQIVLDGVTMTGTEAAIVVLQADKTTITLADGSENSLSDAADRTDVTYDAVIYSEDDLVFNGTGSLTLEGNYESAIKSKDDLRIAGGTYEVSAVKHALSANDNLAISASQLTLTAGGDAIHADNDSDLTLGNVYLADSDLTITATDEGIHATNQVTIASGAITIQNSKEGIEGKQVTIAGGRIAIVASDDGIGASDWTLDADAMAGEPMPGVALTITGGELSIQMAEGDSDAIDSNGDLTVTGGSITITGPSAFDADGTVIYTGGDITVNGVRQEGIELTVQTSQ